MSQDETNAILAEIRDRLEQQLQIQRAVAEANDAYVKQSMDEQRIANNQQRISLDQQTKAIAQQRLAMQLWGISILLLVLLGFVLMSKSLQATIDNSFARLMNALNVPEYVPKVPNTKANP